MTEADNRTVGNYVLGALLGRGGMSEVYAAEHRFLGDPVAIKLIRSELALDDSAIRAFLAEAERTREIAHPNVIRVLDFGRDETSQRCYLVMERIDGGNLAARFREGRIAEPELRALGAEIADGMQAAHARGTVHRDLKPGNVMLRGSHPTIVDFGIAKSLGNTSAVVTSRRIGTLAYMAPEQITGGLISPAVDIWALGVVLFEAATGQLPFSDFADGRCPQLLDAAPRVSSVVPISAAFDAVIARCLEREPGRRHGSMAELAAALRGAAVEERITEDVELAIIAAGPKGSATAARASATRIAWILAIAAAIGTGVLAANLMTCGGEPTGRAPSARVSDPGPPPSPVTPPSPRAPDPGPPPNAPPAAAPDPPLAPAAPETPPPNEPVAVEIALTSMPAGAAIEIDGASRGVTPARLRVRVPTTIVVRRSGYRTARVIAKRPGPIEIRLHRRSTPTRPGETLD